MNDTTEGLPSLPRRVLLLVVDPERLFRLLGKEPVFWGALALGAALTSLAALLIPMEIWEEAARMQALEANLDLPGDPAMMARVSKVGTVLGSFIFWPILAAITAGVLFLVFRFGMGYEGGFRQYLSAAAHALLITAIGGLLFVPVRILTGQPTFTVSLADLFFFLEEGFLFRFLSLMELFSLWVYVLLGVAVRTLDPPRSLSVSIAVSVGIAATFALLLAAFTG